VDTLSRFIEAQARDYSTALGELQRGRKTTHWIWYIFPQLAGLGSSGLSKKYAIKNLDEAKAYLAYPVLGDRLRECTCAVLVHKTKNIEEILDGDSIKLKSSLTLFLHAAQTASDRELFSKALEVFFDGQQDVKTIQLLQSVS
jgi:uncharacterized protein (DUF1810 family)